ncbi:MAG: alginate lyase family protein [Verrucomicrobia bacterium]|nr:alginate lyase family protein [Verrucomicrobiota bacterium]
MSKINLTPSSSKGLISPWIETRFWLSQEPFLGHRAPHQRSARTTTIRFERTSNDWVVHFKCEAGPAAANQEIRPIGDPDLWRAEYVLIQMPVGADGGCLHLTVTRQGQLLSERHDKLLNPITGWSAQVAENPHGWEATITLPSQEIPHPWRMRLARWVPAEGITRWPTPFGSWWHVEQADFLALGGPPAAPADGCSYSDLAIETFIKSREHDLFVEAQTEPLNGPDPGKDCIKDYYLKQEPHPEGAFLDQLTQRVSKQPCLAFGTLPPVEMIRCDDILRNKLWFRDAFVEFGPIPDWDAHRDNLYAMMHVSRFDFLAELVSAHRQQGDPKYARKAIELTESWLEGYDLRQSLTPVRFGVRWCPIIISHRLVCMVRTLFSLLDTGLVREKLLLDLYKAVVEVATALDKRIFRIYPKNHSLIISSHIVQLSVLCAELKRNEWMRQTYFDHFLAALRTQFLPDDVQVELSTMYHIVCYQRITEATTLCEQAGVQVPSEITDWRRRILKASACYLLPNGEVAAFNDGKMSGSGDAIGRKDDCLKDIILREGPSLGIEEGLAIASHGRKGNMTAPFSHTLPFAGHFILRDGLGPSSMALGFDAGPFGTAHAHEDALTLVLVRYGKTLITDIGSGAYDAEIPMRKYSTSTAGHSTICVDGENQATRFFPEQWKRTTPWYGRHFFGRLVQFAAGEYACGYGENGHIAVKHQRAVLFVNHHYVFVLDFLSGQGEHRLESHFTLPPLPFQKTGRELMTTSGSGDLDIQMIHPKRFEATVALGQSEPFAGWVIEGQYGQKPSPRLTFQMKEQLPCCLVTLLTPFQERAEIPEVIGRESDQQLALALSVQGGDASLICSREPFDVSFRNKEVSFKVSQGKEAELSFNEKIL